MERGTGNLVNLQVLSGAKPGVLFVAYQTDHAANGGIASLDEILGRLEKVRPVVVTQREGAQTQAWRKRGLDVRVWSSLALPQRRGSAYSTRLARLARLVQCNLRAARTVRQAGIQVVHCNDGRAALSTALGARLAGAAVVLNIRDTVLGDACKWRLLTRLATHIIVLSNEMAEQVHARVNPGRTPISVSYSVVDRDKMTPASESEREQLRQQLGIAVGVKAIGIVGALMGKKQQLSLLLHLNAHPQHLPSGAEIFLIGDFSPQADDYSRHCWQVASRGPLAKRLHLVGYSDRVGDWYRCLDVTLIASANEGLARAMIESLACGTPVVSFDCCSAREVLEGNQCGLVSPMGKFEALLQQAGRVLDDRVLRGRLAEQGLATVKKLFDPRLVVSVYENVYLQVQQSQQR